MALLPDAGGAARAGKIAPGGPSAIAMPAPACSFLPRRAPPACRPRRSHDAGRYLCNYLCWRGAEAAAKPGGPRIAAFVHVPTIRRKARPRRGKPRLSADDLARAGARLVMVIAAAAR